MLTTTAKHIILELQACAPMTGLEIQAALKTEGIIIKIEDLESEIDLLIDLDLVEYYNFGGFGVDIDDEDFELAYQTSAAWDAMNTSEQEKLWLFST
jgi:hypothetical protein